MMFLSSFLQNGTVFVNMEEDPFIWFDVFWIIYFSILSDGISFYFVCLVSVVRDIPRIVSSFGVKENTTVFSFSYVRG